MIIETPLVCQDYASECCPCTLAQINSCPQCPHLSGGEFCDCNWQGICIYQDFSWKDSEMPILRNGEEMKLLKSFTVSPGTVICYIHINKELFDLPQIFSVVHFPQISGKGINFLPGVVLEIFPQENIAAVSIQIDDPSMLLCRAARLDVTANCAIRGLKELQESKKQKILLLCQGHGSSLAPAVVKNLGRQHDFEAFCPDQNNYFRQQMQSMQVPLLTGLGPEVSLKRNYQYLLVLGGKSFEEKVKKEIANSYQKIPVAELDNSLFDFS